MFAEVITAVGESKSTMRSVEFHRHKLYWGSNWLINTVGALQHTSNRFHIRIMKFRLETKDCHYNSIGLLYADKHQCCQSSQQSRNQPKCFFPRWTRHTMQFVEVFITYKNVRAFLDHHVDISHKLTLTSTFAILKYRQMAGHLQLDKKYHF